MEEPKKYIRFDWAMKKMLRNKANFGILEGFLTTLLNEKIIIVNLLESESNQESVDDKQNRVDLLAENSKGELIIIEVQGNNAYDYYKRMLFATSKLVTQYIKKGDAYGRIKKIFSVNIVYFNVGAGTDIVYHGKTEFRGIHHDDLLDLTRIQKRRFQVDTISQLYPEYYILKVNDFDDVAVSPLEEWIYYLKTGVLSDNASAPGLDEVREKLKLDTLSREEYDRYYKQLLDRNSDNENIDTDKEEARLEGIEQGIKQGLDQGIKQGIKQGLEQGLEQGIKQGLEQGIEQGIEQGKKESVLTIARQMKNQGLNIDMIIQITNLQREEVENL